MEYRIEWPAPMDEDDWELQEVKGWVDVTVERDGHRQVVEVYDPTRLAQSVAMEISEYGCFATRCLLVVESVTRENIESAISGIAGRVFFHQTGSGGATPEASSP